MVIDADMDFKALVSAAAPSSNVPRSFIDRTQGGCWKDAGLCARRAWSLPLDCTVQALQ